MSRIHFDKDIQPLSEFRAGVASYIKQINETRRPLVITQRGKGVAVVLDVAEYEAMQEKIELLTDVHMALNQLEDGAGISHEDAKEKFEEVQQISPSDSEYFKKATEKLKEYKE